MISFISLKAAAPNESFATLSHNMGALFIVTSTCTWKWLEDTKSYIHRVPLHVSEGIWNRQRFSHNAYMHWTSLLHEFFHVIEGNQKE
jgi:hypothetical protein